jgi:hypothetical protein
MNYKTGKYAEKKCVGCGSKTLNIKFCSNKCQQLYSWEKRKKEIEETGVIPERRVGIRYLKETRGDKCEICGLKEWHEKDITMIMDHIDGDSSNNKDLNLRLICPNCDSQLPTYKNRNRGSGRHLRRVRYAEGKSY